jgi:hypothetical protein
MENCALTFVAVKNNLGGLHHSLVTSCMKGRCTFFVFNLHVQGHQGVGQVCVCVSVCVCVEGCADIDAELRLPTYR